MNILRLVIGIMILINLVACNGIPVEKPSVDITSTATTEKPESLTVVVNQNWVIFTKSQAKRMGVASWPVERDDYWTPSADDILKLEEKIAEYLSQNSNLLYRQPPVWERLDEYQRQYIGLELGGKQIIFGNFFCTSGRVNWREELVFMLDGGDCYFQVEYDVESGSFIMLMVNGES